MVTMKYRIKKVETDEQMNDFINLPRKLYKDNPCYVPDLDSDIRGMFDPEKNPGLEFTEVQPFIAYNWEGESVGRIVGIINRKANEIWETMTVRFGYIEFTDDRELSHALLSAVETWGWIKGMTKIEGPMGITDFDKEGMLIEDFDEVGSCATIYNPCYYPKHMEAEGYVKQVDWVQVRMDIPAVIPMRYARVARAARDIFNMSVKKLTKREVFKKGYGQKIFDLLNTCYKPLFGFSELSNGQSKLYIEKYFPILNMKMVPVVEDDKGNLVAIAITLGSITNAMKKANGKMLPFGWLHFLKTLKFKHEEKVEMLLIAVHPEYQGYGINALLFEDLITVYNELGYKWAETCPMLESNTKVLSQWKPFNPRTYKRRRCYCKEL